MAIKSKKDEVVNQYIHDIKNPLTTIRTLAALLSKKSTKTKLDLENYTGKIISNTEKIEQILNKFELELKKK